MEKGRGRVWLHGEGWKTEFGCMEKGRKLSLVAWRRVEAEFGCMEKGGRQSLVAWRRAVEGKVKEWCRGVNPKVKVKRCHLAVRGQDEVDK